MEISAPALSPSTPAAPLRSEDPRLEEAMSQFEALFVGMLLERALQSDDGEEGKGLIGGGPGSSVLSGFVKDTLAREVAQSGALGISEQLRQALQQPGENQ